MYNIHCHVIYCTYLFQCCDLASHLIVNPLFFINPLYCTISVSSDFDLESNNINNSYFLRCLPYNKL